MYGTLRAAPRTLKAGDTKKQAAREKHTVGRVKVEIYAYGGNHHCHAGSYEQSLMVAGSHLGHE